MCLVIQMFGCYYNFRFYLFSKFILFLPGNKSLSRIYTKPKTCIFVVVIRVIDTVSLKLLMLQLLPTSIRITNTNQKYHNSKKLC